ncbi:hypothetical protein I4632_15370 [Proteus mirabilis]|nr:hypothetical protein [Proteus mirabilis]
MHINETKFKINQVDDFNINKKEKYKIKNEINSILNVFSHFYVVERNENFSSKLSFFIKKIFNLKTSLVFLLDKSQHAKLNNLSTLFCGDEKIEFKNCKLINSDFISIKREVLDSLFLSLNTVIKNDSHDNAKKIIQTYLYDKSKTKGDFIAILSISLDLINHYQKEKFEQLSRHSSECSSMLDYIKPSYKQHIDMALNYACKEINGKKSTKMGNSIIYLVNTMHNIYSMEMEKRFIINIAKCFIGKTVKYNVGNYNNDSFTKMIINLLINKLKNNEGVKEFVDNMLGSGLLDYNDIIKEKEKTAEDECYISDYNKKIKNVFSENINSDEIKNNIAKVIRDNYEIILSQMKNKSNYLENERVLLDVIDYLKSENNFNLNLV